MARKYFGDPVVILALMLAAVIVADLGTPPAQDTQSLIAENYQFNQHCVSLAHSIVDYGSQSIERYWQDECPIGTLRGVICGWIDDRECKDRLHEWNL